MDGAEEWTFELDDAFVVCEGLEITHAPDGYVVFPEQEGLLIPSR